GDDGPARTRPRRGRAGGRQRQRDQHRGRRPQRPHRDPTVTHTRPPPTARPAGRRPSRTTATTRFFRASMCETVPSPAFAIQTSYPPAATATGARPTRIFATA